VPRSSPARRAGPGLPLEFEGQNPIGVGDTDSDYDARMRRRRFGEEPYDAPSGRWWRPSSTVGRVFLGLGALIVLGGLTASALLLKTYLDRDAHFRIDGTSAIQATGLTEVTQAEVLPIFGEDIGRNIFFVPLDERRKELESIPWVQQATVMRLLPNQIRLSVVERNPVAFARQGDQIGLVDASGVLLSMSAEAMAEHHYSFPVVTGIDPGDPAASRQARMAVYLRLMSALDSTGQHYSEQISEIDLTDPEDARALMPEQGADILAHFGQDHFLERYLRYKTYVSQWRAQYPQMTAVDLRYDHQVVLEMASGKEASAAETDAGQAKPQAVNPASGAKPQAAKQTAKLAANSVNNAASPAASKNKRQAKSSTLNPVEVKAELAKVKKEKAAQEKKKQAAAKRAALDASRRKQAGRTRQVSAVAEGG
jgi:cell division protein FtsQ